MKSMIGSNARRRTSHSGLSQCKTLFSALIGAACLGWLSAPAAPVTHDISAANVQVIQNDTGNNATSVTLVPSLAINDFRVTVAGTSRADYGVQIGPVAANNVTNGILVSSLSDNGRDNHEVGSNTSGKRYGTSAVDSGASGNPGSSGVWWVPVFGNSTATNVVNGTNTLAFSYVEYNFDFSAAWFPYTKYYGGWLCNSTGANGGVNDRFIGNTNLTFGPLDANVQQEVSGSTVINLTNFGLDARSNAVMICCGGKNEENYAVSKVNWTDGTWTVTCRDDQSGGAEQDYISWVAVPLGNTNGVIAGMFAASLNPAIGVNAVNELQNAPFSATKTGTGTYHLTIPGASPTQGVLIISGSEDGANNADNIVSYQASGDGWDITTMDTGNGKAPTLQNFTAVNQNNPAGDLSDTVVSFVYIPAPSAAITVAPTNGLVTTQGGGTANFSVVLGSVPTSDVTLTLQSSDPTAASLSTSSLVFQSTNYNVPQIVTVTGLNNSVSAAENYTVNFAPAVSTDINYSNMTPSSVALVNIPTGTPGIFLIPATGLTTTGAGGTATFQAIMNQPPTSDVTIGFASSDTVHGGTISPASVTFTADNWSASQIITVTGVDDSIVDGDITYQINSTPAVSSDVNYNGYNAGSVSVVNLENDIANVIVSCGTAISVQEGSTTGFTVALSAPPVSNVTITYAVSDPSAATISPATLTFTPGNWNVPQTVTLTGLANPDNSGDATFVISASVASSNFGYSTLVIPDIAATTAKPIGLPSGPAIYGLGMPPVGLDGQATVGNAVDFSSGASLAFSITANADATDVLGIRNDPSGFGITVSGNTVNYSNNPVATFNGGTGSPLSITVNNGATADAVAALIRSVTFSTATTNDYATRIVQLSLNNGGSIVNKAVRVGQLRVTQYQNGVDWGYGVYNSETNDEIANGTAGVAWPTGSSTINGLLVQGGTLNLTTLHQVLLGFYDLVGTNAGQIPPGSTIVSADLNVNIQKAGQGWAFHRMLTGWDDTYNWNSFPYGGVDDIDDGFNQAELGYDCQMGNFITISNGDGSLSATTAGIKIGLANVAVTPDIQAWVNGTNNFGWVLDASQPWGYNDLTTGTGFTPGQSSTPNLRPRLRVYWLPPEVAGASFQNGTNGYVSGHDTDITQSTPDNNNSTLAVIWSDGADPGQADITEALFQFDDIIGTGPGQIPPGAHIEAAMLNLACLSSTDCNGNGGQFFALYQPWTETNITWNTWNANGKGILNDGVQAAINPTATAGTYTLDANNYVPGGYHSFEVTADVQNWANGAPNCGWGVVPWYISATQLWGADGWGINSSKDPNVSSHPQLIVYYTPTPGYAARPTLLPLVVSPAQVEVKFSGSVGITYTVWRTDSLGGTWTNVGTATVGPDGIATFDDATPLSATGFYRVSTP